MMGTKDEGVTIVGDIFDEFKNAKTGQIEKVFRYTFRTKCLIVQVISYGATVTSIQTPDKHGKLDDVVLGYDDMKGYQSKTNPYFGAVVGRYANRIGNARFQLEDKTYQLAENAPGSHLHGGIIGFDKMNWNSTVKDDRVIFTYLSSDGEEGYPGDLLATVVYRIIGGNRLEITFEAVSTKKTIVNLTNHSYFNLAGHDSGAGGVYSHNMSINADRITVLNGKMTATGEFKYVGGTAYDLRVPKNLGRAIEELKENGFDFNYCLNNYDADDTTNRILFAARAVEPDSGRYLEVHTNQPGVQFYTSNFLADVVGKKDAKYEKHSAFCLETQTYPNSVNVSGFPNSVLDPADKYLHKVWYTFGVQCN